MSKVDDFLRLCSLKNVSPRIEVCMTSFIHDPFIRKSICKKPGCISLEHEIFGNRSFIKKFKSQSIQLKQTVVISFLKIIMRVFLIPDVFDTFSHWVEQGHLARVKKNPNIESFLILSPTFFQSIIYFYNCSTENVHHLSLHIF